MEFIADLHLHSRYSRATAKNLDLEHIYKAAQFKGILLVGTGDFTHPEWFEELGAKLEPAEDGLFRLKKSITDNIDNDVPVTCRKDVRFILQCEISSIYKKDGRVRKNHNLIYFPDLNTVRKFNETLDKIGNITSDGRPILGLSAENLLEIMLETSEEGFLVPAHIWTPWFSMLGSKSGFDSIEECFGKLSEHIFAVETGLSSDPPMNWQVADLDNITLISCSDAHSPMFMGRNASLFDTELSYFSVRDALKKGKASYRQDLQDSSESEKSYSNKFSDISKKGYLGTIDMYPEEGKYHYDGHRNCNVVMHPSESRACGGICPKCSKPLTIGVLYRVQELASRQEGYIPDKCHGFQRIIPLAEILSEICGVGPKSKKVMSLYNKALEKLGPELDILLKQTPDEIEKAAIPLFSIAMERLKSGKIHLNPGFDGEFGSVKLFTPEEIGKLKGEMSIFPVSGKNHKKIPSISSESKKNTPSPSSESKKNTPSPSSESKKSTPSSSSASKKIIPSSSSQNKKQNEKLKNQYKYDNIRKISLNPEQQRAIDIHDRPLLMEAGPGTGKTRTLTEKIASIIMDSNVKPESVLALTFTNKAAEEMRTRIKERLSVRLNKNYYEKDGVVATTFHGFCLMVLKEYSGFNFSIVDPTIKKSVMEDALEIICTGSIFNKGNHSIYSVKKYSHKIGDIISLLKQSGKGPDTFFHGDNCGINEIFKNRMISSIMDELPGIDPFTIFRVWETYQAILARYRLADFEDLMFMVLKLFKEDKKVLDSVKREFQYVFVDEYQDINQAQYKLIRYLAGDGRRLCVIGDPDQSIYGFRGSDNRYFKSFQSDYQDVEKIVFIRNYRSTEIILKASCQLIEQPSMGKEKLFSAIGGGQQINILKAASEKAEAVMIGKTIERLTGGFSMFSMDAEKADPTIEDEYSFSDIAVLYRTGKQGEIFAEVFEKAGIPFQMADRENLYLKPGIKELISFIRILINRATFYDLEILMKNRATCFGGKIDSGKTRQLKKWFYSNNFSCLDAISLLAGEMLSQPTLEENQGNNIISLYERAISDIPPAIKDDLKIADYAASILSIISDCADNESLHVRDLSINSSLNDDENKCRLLSQGVKIGDIILYAVEKLGVKDIIDENQTSCDLVNSMIKESEKFEDLAGFYEMTAMKSDSDVVDNRIEKVSLMTLHASKGLEFKVVFVAGCENGLIPFNRPGKPCIDIEEERRLFYVAMTRAERVLYLSFSKKRKQYGKLIETEKSLFLEDIEETLKLYLHSDYKKTVKNSKNKQLSLFS
ncbi:PcrA2 [Desulfamplus magnetovallimortis]|uniref:DNA 3'-5' helicase n=1 Tax=Desulfamplus magnetovallimortis TaxID=1246637 RepID=A0A1W1HAM3_9BACT|nr:UvrD-helicase domain-containing protein [Desulfamplus magnetovallimortis]SLM29527.1 PcrA2 [Desulfamplus magnetovallimortis]